MHVRPGRCAATIVNNIADVDLFQFGPEMCQGHPRSTCPPPETRSFSRNSDYAAPDSSRSSASSQDQSRSFTKAPRSNYRKPEYETESDNSSQGLARALRRLHMPKSQSATTGPGSTKRKRVEVESDDLDEAQMEWRHEQSAGARLSQWPAKRMR